MTRRLENIEFFKRAVETHGDTYLYDRVDVKGTSINIKIGCKYHGYFMQQPRAHISGQGCPQCGRKSAGETKSMKFDEFVERSNLIHGNRYEYISENYNSLDSIISITCIHHGIFSQRARDHLSGRGCPCCGLLSRSAKRKSNTKLFIEKSLLVHGDKYSYEDSVYIRHNKKIDIFCKKHGIFSQSVAGHLSGSGCPQCSSSGISKCEIEWLNMLNIPKYFRNQRIIIGEKLYKPDAVDIQNKIIYEFNGDFWHGNLNRYDPLDINSVNKETFGDLYLKTLNKKNIFRDAGFIVISIWESEWNKYKDK